MGKVFVSLLATTVAVSAGLGFAARTASAEWPSWLGGPSATKSKPSSTAKKSGGNPFSTAKKSGGTFGPDGKPRDAAGNTVKTASEKFSAGMASVGNSFKGVFQKTSQQGSGKAKPQSDALSLSNPAHPSAEFFVSVARLQERSGNYQGAIEQFKRALEVDKYHLGALLGLARLYDRQDQLSEATKYYLRATEHYPKEPAALNDLGLCFARQDMFAESVAVLERAVALQPDRVLYRNNLATVLVQTDRIDEAIECLTRVHGKTVAHYNVGFLLNKRGKKSAALEQFELAAQNDPSFAAARQWVETLSAELGSPVSKPAPTAIISDGGKPPADRPTKSFGGLNDHRANRGKPPRGPALQMTPERVPAPSREPANLDADEPAAKETRIQPLPPIDGSWSGQRRF
jgi:tetratricopeptide (TPR) repeat protein